MTDQITVTPHQRHQEMLAHAAQRRQARRDLHERTNRERLAAAVVSRMEKALQAHLDAVGAGIVVTSGASDLWYDMHEFIATGMRGGERVCIGCFTSDDRRSLDLAHPEDVVVFAS